MARKIRFFHDQVCAIQQEQQRGCATMADRFRCSLHVQSTRLKPYLVICLHFAPPPSPQVEKAGLAVGIRALQDKTYDMDELEVGCCCASGARVGAWLRLCARTCCRLSVLSACAACAAG